jgi:filamentous hemagglutinin family protein
MTLGGCVGGWKLGLGTSLALGGLVLFGGDYAKAQIKADETLGNERSVVTHDVTIKDLPADRIDGGATRGGNLFHSFSEFNVGKEQRVYFANPTGIQNIFSRVRGTNSSAILGTLGVQGNANLFLLNPNGIIFGPNAKLDIGGSFLGSTANRIKFADGTKFSATDPTTPPLLTISVPIGLQYGGTLGGIRVQGSSLQVKPGQTLALVGGNVSMDGGLLKVPGGRVELGGLTGTGTVGLTVNGNDVRLSFPESVPGADISLTQGALVDVTAGGGGSIHVNAGNLHLDNSVLLAGIGQNLGSPGSVAGDIEINATERINLANKSFISNRVQTGAVGQGGNVKLTTGSLSVTNGAQLQTVTSGLGNAGSVNIQATDTVFFDGVGSIENPSGAFSHVKSGATGQGGNVKITTGSLSLTNGAQLQTVTSGLGNAGSVNIQAADTVIFDGVDSTGASSGAFSFVESGAKGNGGDVNLTAQSLFVTKGAALATSTSGVGNAGNVKIFATDKALFEGMGSDGRPSAAFSQVTKDATGQGGDVEISVGSLSVTKGAALATSIFGVRNGGNVKISARSLSVTNGGQLNASTGGQGNAGSVTITATDAVSFDGGSALSLVAKDATGNGGNVKISTGSLSVSNGAQLNASTYGKGDAGGVMITARDTVSFDNGDAFSNIEAEAEGKSGGINIQARSLSVRNGAQLQALTRGQGDSGDVTIKANDTVSFDGVGANGLSSSAFSTVEKGAEGNGGNINIMTGSLSVTNGAQLNASTYGKGDAGSITITAHDTVSFEGMRNGFYSTAFSNVGEDAVGKGGELNITTGSLTLRNGAQLQTSTYAAQDAGSISITAHDTVSFDGVGTNGLPSGAFSTVEQKAEGNGGEIDIMTRSLSVTSGAQLDTSTYGKGDAGSVRVTATDTVSFEGMSANGLPSGAGSTVAKGAEGQGGSVIIDARHLNLRDGAAVAVESQGTKEAGEIEITAETITLDNRGFITAKTLSTNGGNINLQVWDYILMRNNSQISTTAGTAQTGGNGGNITIDAPKGFIVGVSRENSDITANAFEGNGGNINITAQRIFGLKERPNLTPRSDITASSEFGIDGVIETIELGIDPNNGLANLPEETLPELIEQRCQVGSRGVKGEFRVSGRGGLPPNPTETLGTNRGWVDTRSYTIGAENSSGSAVATVPISSAPAQIVEAQGWIINAKGQVELVAKAAANATFSSSLQTPKACD